MKKLFLISALTLMMGATLPVYATEIDQDTKVPGETTVTYGVNSSYTVTIPADFNLSGTTEVTQIISASEVYIPSGKTLQVSISSDNYVDPNWNLVDKSDTTNKIAYTIRTDEGNVANSDIILEVAAGEIDGAEKDLYFKVNTPATKAGTYEDTLSFTVTVK